MSLFPSYWDIALEIFFITVVGTGSRSQYESDDWESRLSISSKVAGVKEWSRGGGESERKWAGVKEGLVCRLEWSFEILSEKYVANSCGRAARRDDVPIVNSPFLEFWLWSESTTYLRLFRETSKWISACREGWALGSNYKQAEKTVKWSWWRRRPMETT